jgi:hypothetical protein
MSSLIGSLDRILNRSGHLQQRQQIKFHQEENKSSWSSTPYVLLVSLLSPCSHQQFHHDVPFPKWPASASLVLTCGVSTVRRHTVAACLLLKHHSPPRCEPPLSPDELGRSHSDIRLAQQALRDKDIRFGVTVSAVKIADSAVTQAN